MKRLALAIALISTALLSGCIIVPARHGGYHRDGYYRDGGHQRDGGYYRGSVYVQPGRR